VSDDLYGIGMVRDENGIHMVTVRLLRREGPGAADGGAELIAPETVFDRAERLGRVSLWART
jgi:hypothetical protein